jgi:hypothetical protein
MSVPVIFNPEYGDSFDAVAFIERRLMPSTGESVTPISTGEQVVSSTSLDGLIERTDMALPAPLTPTSIQQIQRNPLSITGGAALVGTAINVYDRIQAARKDVKTKAFDYNTDTGPPTVEQLEAATGIKCKKRRRRRRMLTASDKADIAFLRGNLGGGELGRAAITAVLSRRLS